MEALGLLAGIENSRTIKPQPAMDLATPIQCEIEAGASGSHQPLSSEPEKAETFNNLGNIFKNQGKWVESMQCYYMALSYKWNVAETHNNLGNLLREVGRPNDAKTHFNAALSIAPNFADAHVGLANIHIDLGQFEVAQTALFNALRIRPQHSAALATFPRLQKMTQADDGWLSIALGLVSDANSTLPPHEIISILFAIGKYYDDTEQFDLAFDAYRRGNQLKRKIEGGFDRMNLTRIVDRLISVYTKKVVRKMRDNASLSQRPVLVVGMVRSGTSLIEQIIASHPDAFGAGELLFWNRQAMENQNALLSGNYENSPIAGIAATYEQLLQQHSADAIRTVDKMPINLFWLGLIHAVFPQAKIIHAKRNPADTCLSVYFQNLLPTHSYGTDLDDLAFFYREYARLMRHWDAVLPEGTMLDVPYEELVVDPSTWSKRIIEFIGLNWDECCLNFHKTQRKVGTASNWQVRQEIYTTSMNRWRHYENHLGPLRDLLEVKR